MIIFINNNDKLRWCTRPGCETVIEKNTKSNKLKCPKCSQYVCYICKEDWHENTSKFKKNILKFNKDCEQLVQTKLKHLKTLNIK